MNVFEEVELPAVPAKTINQQIGVACDICLVFYEGSATDWKYHINWKRPNGSSFDIQRTALFIEEGSSFGSDGTDITTRYTQICPNCFRTKVIPFIERLMDQGEMQTYDLHI